MKLTFKLALGLSIIAATSVAFYCARRSTNTKQMLNQIADEGYETAYDILFPDNDSARGQVHYGPVIPR